jgi:hypothetical protein
VSTADGTSYVVVTGGDNHIYLESISPTDAVSGFWELPGGGMTPSAPASVVDAQGNYRVYVRGYDDQIWVNINQSSWAPLTGGGMTTDAPSAVLFQGSVYLFVRGLDGQLWGEIDEPGQNSWVALGGWLASGPSATVQTNQIKVAVTGGDNAVWMLTLPSLNNSWGYTSWGGITPSAPGVFTDASGNLRAVARGTDNSVWMDTNNAGFQPVPGGGMINSAPSGAVGGGRVRLFVTGVDSALYFMDLN